MVKHIIDIPDEINKKIKYYKIEHNLSNVSDVIEHVIEHAIDTVELKK